MAQRRMFSMTVVDTDRFLEMPTSAQALYFHLSMRADDDGFVSSPKRILRTIGSADDDLKILIAKRFIIPFPSGVCVITDWKQNNYIRTDRYSPTVYCAEMAALETLSNNSYRLPSGIPNDNQLGDIPETQVRLVKDRQVEGSIGKDTDARSQRIEPPSGDDAAIETPPAFLTLNDNSRHPISEEQVKKWSSLYPSVDVMQELRNMEGWLDANPTKRKTKSGINRFINGWLSREQDKGGSRTTPPAKGGNINGEDRNTLRASGGFKRDAFEGFHMVGEPDTE